MKGKNTFKEFIVADAAEGQAWLCVPGHNIRTNRRRSEEGNVSVRCGRMLSYIELPPKGMGMLQEELVSLSLEVLTREVCNRQGSHRTLYALERS